MKVGKIMMFVSMFMFSSVIFAEDFTPEQKQALDQKAMHEMLQKIFYRAMEAKRAFQSNQLREDPIANFATTAPRSEFVVNADISEELQSGTQSATVYVSTDNQSTWQSAQASLIGTEGFETTWGGTINTGNGSSAYSYLSGVVDSEALGESFGTIIVSGTPHNVSGEWPPPANLYADMVNEPSGETSSNYDIVSLKGTYQGNDAIDSDGNEYTDIERIYMNLSLSGDCCDEGGLFGPWYLYGVGIVNPESEEAVAYAIGYGDGGFGQLTPGLLKLSGDLSSGELGGFEYLSTNISYSTAGNDMQATVLMDLITSDSQWGSWPNSYNGFIVLGVTVEASLDGLDVAAELLDQTDPGLMVCTTTFQDGNTLLALSNPNFDSETNTLSVSYMDSDGNLPWFRSAQICNSGTSNCFHFMDMIPDNHTYEETVIYVASFTSVDVPDGDYDAKFWFADDDIDSYPDAQITYPISVGSGSDCSPQGDINADGILNVLDIVLLVNVVLGGEADCSDINNDAVVNVLDIVLLVNLVLG
tara:strand:+ start:521 stop:2110 length:1590 start_codon:yes stop_codon:yes gene_type:complete